MVSKILACVNCFEEVDLIGDSLRTVLPYVDGVILVDGAYPEYPQAKNDISMDGTVELAKYVTKQEFNKEFHLVRPGVGRWTEVQKRTAYFDYIRDYLDYKATWTFIWDADFFLTAFDGHNGESSDMSHVQEDFDVMRSTDKFTLVQTPIFAVGDIDPRISWVRTGFRAIPGIHYTQNHFTIRDLNDVSIGPQMHQTYMMRYAMIKHDMTRRHPNRRQRQKEYYSNVFPKYEH